MPDGVAVLDSAKRFVHLPKSCSAKTWQIRCSCGAATCMRTMQDYCMQCATAEHAYSVPAYCMSSCVANICLCDSCAWRGRVDDCKQKDPSSSEQRVVLLTFVDLPASLCSGSSSTSLAFRFFLTSDCNLHTITSFNDILSFLSHHGQVRQEQRR